MPLAPNLIERTVFLTLNQAPGPILDLWSGAAFHTVLAAIRNMPKAGSALLIGVKG